MRVVYLTTVGCMQVLEGKPGMCFPVNSSHHRRDGGGEVMQVRDYRYKGEYQDYQIWTLVPGDYVEVFNVR